VVLDFSFWTREMRDDYRRLLEPIGVIAEAMYLATERATILERVAARRTSHADDYELDEFIAGSYFDRFEPPTPAEGPLTVITQRSGDAPPCPRQQPWAGSLARFPW